MTDNEPKVDRDSLRVEYELSQKMHNYYGKTLWEIGSIYLAASLAGFAFAIQQDLPKHSFIPLISVLTVLLVSFLLTARRFRKFGFLHLSRCREIEEILGLKQHTYSHKAIDEKIIVAGSEIKIPRPHGVTLNVVSVCVIAGIFWISIWRHEIFNFFKHLLSP